jgi:hypothetical protein
VGLGTPEAALWALPFVSHAEVNWPGFPHHGLQHLAPAMVAIFWAFAASVVRWWPALARSARRLAWTRAVLLVALTASLAQFTGGAWAAYLARGMPRHPELFRVVDSLPPDATVVVVPDELAARFSHHTRVITGMWPMPRRFRSDEERRETLAAVASAADLVAPGRNEPLEEAVLRSGRFLPPREISGYRVFLLRSEAPRSSTPDRDLQRAFHWNELKRHQRRWVTLRVDG